MVVQLVITEEMIKCFHSCASEGNFQPLFKDYELFFDSLAENLKKVNFPGNTFHREISENLTDIFRYVMNSNPNKPRNYIWRNEIPSFFEQLKIALISKDWQNLYEGYQYAADTMIESARRQGVMDLKIAWGSIIYDFFVDRRLAIMCETRKTDVNTMLKESHFRNVEKKTTGQLVVATEMMQEMNLMKNGGGEDFTQILGIVDKTLNDQESEMKLREEKLERNMEEMMNEKIERKLNELVAKFEKNAQNREEQLKLKEETLDRKIEEIKVKEESLELKLEAVMERHVQEQKEEFKLNEEMLNRKIEELLVVKLEAMIKRSVQKQKEQLKLKEDLLSKKFKKMETVVESLNKKLEAAIERNDQEKLKLNEDLLNKKIGEMKTLEDSLDKKIGAAIEKTVQEQLKLKDTLLHERLEYSLKEKIEETIKKCSQEQSEQLKLKDSLLNEKIEAEIEKRFQEQKEQLKSKENLLNNKMEDMKIREDSLNEKLEETIERNVQEQMDLLKSKEEIFDRKIEEVKTKEEFLDKKIDAMLELMTLFEQQNQPKVVESRCSKTSEGCSISPVKSTDRFQVIEEAIEPDPRYYQSTSEELRQIQEEFEKKLAEQAATHAAEMEAVKERRRQKKEKAQGEIGELSRSVSRAMEQASFRP